MRALFLLLLSFSIQSVAAQKDQFPQGWMGNWSGELQWFRTGTDTPQKVKMQLRIQRTDSVHIYTWQMIYGNALEDNRPYTLMAIDAAKGHWAVDEHNGIVLDQYWVGNKFCSSFTVKNSTIVNNCWMENGKLMVEFISMAAKPVRTSGNGNEEIPFAYSYEVKGYQLAVLTRE